MNVASAHICVQNMRHATTRLGHLTAPVIQVFLVTDLIVQVCFSLRKIVFKKKTTMKTITVKQLESKSLKIVI